MILCDVNVWLALALSGHVHHGVARDWLDTVDEPRVIHFCRATQQGLLRLLTTQAVMLPQGREPLANAEAWAVYEALLGDDRVTFLRNEPAGLESTWRGLAFRDTASPKLWMDAYLAAFAIAGRLRLVTTDAAFRQFDQLDLHLLDPS